MELPRNMSEKNFKCEICEKVFKTFKTFKKHFTSVHDNKGKLIVCNICRRNFETQISYICTLHNHQLSVHVIKQNKD